MTIGKQMLGMRHVHPAVTKTLTQVQVEGTFPSGTFLVTVDYPISSGDGNLEQALYGSFLPVPADDTFPPLNPEEYEPEKMPGAVITLRSKKVYLNEGRKRIKLTVTSVADRPIQVGFSMSYYMLTTKRCAYPYLNTDECLCINVPN